ncbi:MAG: DUF4240 domain-containing protein [Chloroflexota bacterium]
MNAATFWNLLKRTKEVSAGDGHKQAELLYKALLELSADDILSYYIILTQLIDRAYSWDLWAAAHIINCGTGDDGFTDFRAWLICQGEYTFNQVLKDPELLVNIVEYPPDTMIEELGFYAPLEAYEEKTGHLLPDFPYEPAEISGEKWEEEDLRKKYPKLWTKFGDCSYMFGTT